VRSLLPLTARPFHVRLLVPRYLGTYSLAVACCRRRAAASSRRRPAGRPCLPSRPGF